MENKKNRTANLLPIDTVGLWQGCMLALTVNAVMLVEYPFIIDEHIWIDGFYITLNHEGAKAVISFTEDNIPVAGLFREFSSERTELVLSDKYAASHFKAAPEQIQSLAKKLFPVLNEEVGDKTLPLVTTGFWVEENGIYSADSYDDWYEHGGLILDTQMMPFEEAMDYYIDIHNMDEPKSKLVERIYGEKIRQPDKKIILTSDEINLLKEMCEYNIPACREVFGHIGVFFE